MAAVAVSAMLIVGGTLAYFTATEEATNTFTVGKVNADLTETLWCGDASNQSGNSAVSTAPSGGWGASAALTIAPGRVINKNSALTIKADSESCYARLVVTMPTEIYDITNLFAILTSLSTRMCSSPKALRANPPPLSAHFPAFSITDDA